MPSTKAGICSNGPSARYMIIYGGLTYDPAYFTSADDRCRYEFNPLLMNGFSHHYPLAESAFIFRGVRSDFYFLYDFSMKCLRANRRAPDGTPRSAASHLGLYCLPVSHKKEARLK